LLSKLFPDGLESPDLRQELATGEFINVPEKFTELLGNCLWDILSSNHDLIFPRERIVH
jgi:hypothetical protein